MTKFICPRCGSSDVRTSKIATTIEGKRINPKNIMRNDPEWSSKFGKVIAVLLAITGFGFIFMGITTNSPGDAMGCMAIITIITLAVSIWQYKYYDRMSGAVIQYSHRCSSCGAEWTTDM